MIDITPPVGLELAGWAFGPSVGVHDELKAKAICLESGGERFMLITADLIGVGTDSADTIRSEVAAAVGTDRDHVIVSCSHTHSGPGTMPIRRWGAIDETYLSATIDKLIHVGTEAAKQAKESAGIGSLSISVHGISENRRKDRGDLKDDDLGLLRIDGADGSPTAVVMNYSCHPVAAHNDRNLISADYPGYAMRLVEQTLGGDVAAMFTTGAAGDINPVRFHHLDYAEEYGNLIGEAVVENIAAIPLETDLSIRCAAVTVELPVQQLPDETFLRAEIVKWNAEAVTLTEQDAARDAVDNALIKKEWAEEALCIVQKGDQVDHLPMEVHAVGLNDTAILSLPVELFVGIGLEIKSTSPFRHTMISELTNGSLCYLPTSDAYARGGYETEFASKVYGIHFLNGQAEPIVEEAARKLLISLHE